MFNSLSPIGPGHNHDDRERREIGNTYFQNPDAWTRQFYLQQQNNAMQQQNKMLAQANWVGQLRNLYGPQFTLVQAHDATNAAAGSRVQRVSVWDRARFLTGTEPPVGPLRGFPLTPGAAEQQRNGGPSLTPRTRAQVFAQQQGYRPYGQRQERGPSQGPNIPQTINTNIDVSHLSPYGPEMIVPIEQQQPPRPAQRPVQRVRTGIGAWPMVAGTYFSQPRQAPQPRPFDQSVAKYETQRKMNGQTNAKLEAQRKQKIQRQAAPGSVGGRTQETAKKRAEQSAKYAANRTETQADFRRRQEEMAKIEQQIKQLQTRRSEREKRLGESQKRLTEERNRAAESLAKLRKQTEVHNTTIATLDKQIAALREQIEKAQKDGDNALALKLTAERANLQEQRQKEMQTAVPLLAQLQKTLASFETLVKELTTTATEIEREQKEFQQQLEALQKQLKILTGRSFSPSPVLSPAPSPNPANTTPSNRTPPNRIVPRTPSDNRTPSNPPAAPRTPPQPNTPNAPRAPEYSNPPTYEPVRREGAAVEAARKWADVQVKRAAAIMKVGSAERQRAEKLDEQNRTFLINFVNLRAVDGFAVFQRTPAASGSVDRYHFDVDARQPPELRGRWNMLAYGPDRLVIRRDSEVTARTNVPPTQIAFLRSDVFREGGSPSIRFDTIRTLMQRAVEERRSGEQDAADIANFDLPRDRPVGLISLMDDRDRWEGYPRFVGGILAGRYRIVRQRDYLNFVTSDPIPYLREQIGAMRNCSEPVRDFLLCMTPHGTQQLLQFTRSDGSGTITVRPEALMKLFAEFPDCRFTLLINSCFGGGFDSRAAFQTPERSAGRVTVFLQVGETVPNIVPATEAERKQGEAASLYDTLFIRYLSQGMAFGEAHLSARRDLAAVNPGAAPRVRRTGTTAGGTMTVDRRTPEDELPGGAAGQA